MHAAAAAAGQPDRLAARLAAADQTLRAAAGSAAALQARPAASTAIDQLRADLQQSESQFSVREAAREEQGLVYSLAASPDQEGAVLARLPAGQAAGLGFASDGLRATWRLDGVQDPSQVHPRLNHRFLASEPVPTLLGYYRAAAARTGVDWSYLAAINYIESDFGRVLGPSAAGALGPMQFLPSTWRQYGGDGDIMSPHDSIQAAALLLARNGAPGDYGRALLHYNRDADYVAAVTAFAAALRTDPLWLTRLNAWSTFG